MTSYSGVHIQHRFKHEVQQPISVTVNFHSRHNNRRESSRNVLLSATTPFENCGGCVELSNEIRCTTAPLTGYEGTTSSEGSQKLWNYRRPSQAAALPKYYQQQEGF
jgi:hypothetical protein